MRLGLQGFIYLQNLIDVLFYMTHLLIRADISKLYLSLARLSLASVTFAAYILFFFLFIIYRWQLSNHAS